MTRWTKPEDYTAKALAWTMLRERGLVPIRVPSDNDLRRDLFPTTRIMGYDLSREPDKSVRAKWINGRLWILG